MSLNIKLTPYLILQLRFSWDEKKTRKETRLVIVVGLLAVAVIALVATLTLQMAVFRKEEYREMCQSDECIKTGNNYNDHGMKTL